MKLRHLLVVFITFLAFGQAQRPLQLNDLVSWKRIGAPALSADGEWFAYRLAPAEGDAEVVIRNLKTGKDLRFPIGDPGSTAPSSAAPAPAPSSGASLAISDDSRWAAFSVYPTEKEAKQLKKNRRPLETKVVLVELATGKKTEFERTRRFAFSGEKSTVLALHRYGAAAPATPAPAPAATGSGPATPPDRPTGSDLILYDLATGDELNVGNVSEFSFNKPGDWLAWVVDAQDKAGNGVSLRNMTSGVVLPLDHAKASYRSLTWTEKGDGLTALRGVDDKGFEDKLYAVVAFKDFASSAPPAKFVFDPKDDKSFPAGMTVASTRPAAWREDLSSLMFGIREVKAKKTPDPEKKEGAPAPARRRCRRRSQTRSRPLALQRPAPAIDATGAGNRRSQFQLRRRLPSCGQEVHPSRR